MTAAANPIIGRLNELRSQAWLFLEHPTARVLRWLLLQDERKMIGAFVAVESEKNGQLPALILRSTLPFEDEALFGFALCEGLKEAYAARRDEMQRDGFRADWQPPTWSRPPTSAAAFVETCHSLLHHYADLMPAILMVMTPEKVSSGQAFERWLLQVARLAEPALRIAVVDDAGQPSFTALGKEEKLVLSVKADLDMPGALSEIAATAEDAEQPSGQFRQHFVALGNAAEKGDLAGMHRSADAARDIATAQDWLHLVVTIECARAAVLTGKGQLAEALEAYGRADQAAVLSMSRNEPAGPRLRLTVQMGMGSAWIAGADLRQAAQIYEGCVPLAEQAPDAMLKYESLRLAAWCHESSRAYARAWSCGLEALDAAAALEEPLRKSSTIPYLGECLLRLTTRWEYGRHAREIEQRIVGLVGRPDWRPEGNPTKDPKKGQTPAVRA